MSLVVYGCGPNVGHTVNQIKKAVKDTEQFVVLGEPQLPSFKDGAWF